MLHHFLLPCCYRYCLPFSSTTYTYHGLDYERPPLDTTEVIFHPSVTVTKESVVHVSHSVFYGCDRLSTTVRNNLSKVCYSTRTSVTPQTAQNALLPTELNLPPRLTINKWQHCISYVPILTLLEIASVRICNWPQKLPIRRTRKEWLLFSVFVGMTLLSWMTGTFLLWWYGGTIACLPRLKWTRRESVNDHAWLWRNVFETVCPQPT